MCYFTAIGIKPKFEDKLEAVKSSYKVKPCKNSTITAYSKNFKWFWIYDKTGHCSCDLFKQNNEIFERLSGVVSEAFTLNLINHFYSGNPDEEELEFSEKRIEQASIKEGFDIPDDVMLKIVKGEEYELCFSNNKQNI